MAALRAAKLDAIGIEIAVTTLLGLLPAERVVVVYAPSEADFDVNRFALANPRVHVLCLHYDTDDLCSGVDNLSVSRTVARVWCGVRRAGARPGACGVVRVLGVHGNIACNQC